MKKLTWTIFILAVIVTILLIAVAQYYVAVALVLGTIIMRHRELWSLLTTRKLPPVDERVRENTGKAIRNGFIYFAVVTVFLMLPLGGILTSELDIQHILSALFLSAGLVYMITYIYFDRAEPKMNDKRVRIFKRFLWLIGISVSVFIIGAFLHNAFYAIFGLEEPVFFVIAVLVAPAALAVGIIGSVVLFIMGLATKPS